MFTNSLATYDSLKLPCRELVPVAASADQHLFLLGSCSLHESNEIHLLKFIDDSNELFCAHIYSHPDEIWKISTSPTDLNAIVTCHKSPHSNFSFSLWKFPESLEPVVGGSNIPNCIENLSNFGNSTVPACAILWDKISTNLILTVHGSDMVIWDVTCGGSPTISFETKINACSSTSSACLDPHTHTSFSVASDRDVYIVDTRNGEASMVIKEAHSYACRDVDYSRQKPNTLVSCGEDRLLRFWDLRKPDKPLKSILGHRNHWATTVKYNPFHDQLLASGGSDAAVSIWRVASLSSAPAPLALDEEPESFKDVRVKTIKDHANSISSIAWSSYDAWVLASLSHNGRVLVNHVPSTEKYKILL